MQNLIDELKAILDGIDKTECESEDGWWETSVGADFGAKKLEEVIAAVERHLKQQNS